ncbi:hypothetical protein [Bradyrhizobium sp.]|uniref:hypothetical protein n=1 Tax=Bradyrhizobium sp. TaxID=376 RepID=UPI00260282EF|nr:hypothetical protein [Bradyrhizobium sp.]
MSLAVKEREAPAWQVFPVVETIAGFGNAQNLMAFSGNNAFVTGSNLVSNATIGVSLGGTYFASIAEYDPAFVQSILQADAEPPEASHNNVVDMLDWLNRE